VSGRAPRAARALELVVGDLVVYGGHGAGRVCAREPGAAGAAPGDVVVVELGDGLVVTLPLDQAHERLRPVAGEAELARVRATLRDPGTTGEEAWLSRSRETREKVALGHAVGLAEVVRDGARRDGTAVGAGGGRRLSLGERQLYLKARRLLAVEIGLARGVDPSEADAWIARQLSCSDV